METSSSRPQQHEDDDKIVETWEDLVSASGLSPAAGGAEWNTMCYLFFHMRCAILVRAEGGRVATFQPFAFREYRNNWRLPLKYANGSREHTIARDRARFGPAFLDDERRWWANGGTISNVLDPEGPAWGGFHFAFLRKVAGVIAHKKMPDSIFFMNKRDHPLLRKDRREPYSAAFGGEPPDIAAEGNAWLAHRDSETEAFAPIYSYYTNAEHEDLPMPVETDLIPVPTVDWHRKIPFAFFRGGATGYDVRNNPRVRLCEMRDPRLDARLTSYNFRHKFQQDGSVAVIQPAALRARASRNNFVPAHAWARYKYLVYIDGNVGASRLGCMLATGSVCLVVRSRLPQPFVYHLIQPWVHYVPCTLESLSSVLTWCENNPAKCKEIAHNAVTFITTFWTTWQDKLK